MSTVATSEMRSSGHHVPAGTRRGVHRPLSQSLPTTTFG